MADKTEQAPPAPASQEEQPEKQEEKQETPVVEAAPVDADADASKKQHEEEEEIKSKRVTLADLSAKGTTLYAHKNYEEAAEVFSEASILQAAINGETSPDNAEILFHYGRSLFKVGQSKSDVLGGSAPEAKPAKAKPAVAPKPSASTSGDAAATADGNGKPEVAKPLFQFTGDENFDDDSDEDAAPAGEEEEEEEEEDDLATAFEILDLARVCYLKRLEQLQDEQGPDGKGRETAANSSIVRHVKERLADTHDALSEISLENERYLNAIEDGRTSLKYKLELYPEESEIIAEAHYKLSLSLEFASVTTSGDNGTTAKREEMDQGLRDEAISEMELAIKSFRLKLDNKEIELASSSSPEDNDLARKSIAEMKELITDMEQRLVDLRSDPIDTKGLMGAEANPLGGILGAALGETSEDAQARIAEATKTATDLSSMVRRKKPKTEVEEPETGKKLEAAAAPAEESATAGAGKRKAGDEEEDSSTKRAKTEEPVL
ncbi:HAT1-interacting factor 1 [Geosmithia morbida]|uniref:HAT1-interacting factor 1 n=1 Tax=Geosmithia morbida TaxID=1094350 RepID=A0A9P5CZ01_9HYPO|nr:HAT1-interacting factor 1 [Geosmithia morbida]KAF4121023.1 HAT1-interacting factor 1 [Geosmithia morbida]